ncbi:MAG: radical SAM protein [Candidatus Eisenbacteria bacterium]
MSPQADKPEVLLIQPGEETDYYLIPMGLLYVAQALREAGVEVTIFDMRKSRITDLPLRRYLFAGITMMTGKMIKHGLRAARMIREYDPRIPIVLGGVHPSMLPEQTLRHELADIVVVGEGEETAKEIARSLLGDGDLSEIKGIGYKGNGNPITMNPRREFIDLNETSMDLPHDLLGIDFQGARAFPINTSRGCPYRCGFCYNQSFNKRSFRYKSATRIVDEVEYYIKKYDIPSFSFGFEDEFFSKPSRVREMADLILSRDLKITWGSFCRFDSFEKIDDHSLKLLKRSGCKSLFFGAESGSQRILDEVIKKDITTEQVVRGVERLKRADIFHLVSFMCCLPTETQEDLDATFALIDRIAENNSKLFINGIFVYFPIPGTPLFDMVKNGYDLEFPDCLEGWAEYEMPSASISRIPWHPAKYARRCRNLYQMSLYPFHHDITSYGAYRQLTTTHTSYRRSYVHYLMARMQRWRWKNRNLEFPLELLMSEKIREMTPALRRGYRMAKKVRAHLR